MTKEWQKANTYFPGRPDNYLLSGLCFFHFILFIFFFTSTCYKKAAEIKKKAWEDSLSHGPHRCGCANYVSEHTSTHAWLPSNISCRRFAIICPSCHRASPGQVGVCKTRELCQTGTA